MLKHFNGSLFAIRFCDHFSNVVNQFFRFSCFDRLCNVVNHFCQVANHFLSSFFAMCSITFVDHFFGDQFFRSLLQCVQSLFLFSLSHVFKHFSGSLFWITFSCHFCNELIHFSAHFFRSLLHYLSHFFRSLLQCGQSLFSITFCSHFLGSLFSLTFDRLTFLFCAPSRKK